ncbi:MAG: pentapeptide repeat-containing protein [Methyloceanibacter sp.]
MANQSHRRSSAEDAPYRSKLKRIESSVGNGTRPRNHAEILRLGPAAWNAWRNKNGSIRPDLNGLTLTPGERQMGPKQGGPINLRRALLRGAALRSARLPGADIEGADLSGADLCHGRLNQAKLRAAILWGARLDHANLTGASGRKANLRGARMHAVSLTDADFAGADFTGADLLHARLQAANLAGANFSHARLDHADFAGANLKGANLAGASLEHAKNLTSAQLETAKGDASTSLPPHLEGTVSWSPARRERRAPAFESRTGARGRPRHDPAPRRFYQRALWIVGIVLWTIVIIGFAVKHRSEAVPFLPQVTLPLPEFALAAAVGPELMASGHKPASASDVTKAVLRANPAHDLAVDPASTPRLFAALGERRVAALPAPAIVDETPNRSLPVATELRAEPLQQIVAGPTAEAVQPDTSLTAVQEEAAKVRVAALKQTTLWPVNKIGTVRLHEAPADIQLAEGPDDGPMTLIVSLRAQRLDVYRGARMIATSEISSGMEGHETMAGVFSILEKRRHHHSNMYSNAPMPWMQRLTRSGTAIHGGVVPGHPASHGCIRVPFTFATKLFQMTTTGMNVVVADEELVPVSIDHPTLPQPLTAAIDEAPPLRILVTRRTLRDRLISLQQALADMGYLPRQNFTGRVGRQTTAAIRAFEKTAGLPETGKVTKELTAAIYKATGQEEPPAGHLFVRQGNRRLFDMPVVFSDPERTLGTHIFAGMYRAPGTTEIEWLAMSLDGGDAASALDRIHIPEALRQKLAEALTPGSTFIIGDLSLHTSILPDGDDFVVLTKDVPIVAETPKPAQQAVRKKAPPKWAKRSTRRATREARRSFSAPIQARRGLFSRW